MTSPAMTVQEGSKFHSVVVTSEKKIVPFENDQFKITPVAYPLWNTPQERYWALARTFIHYIMNAEDPVFGIESYSMGSKGRVFDIAEATQMIKFTVWNHWAKEMIQFAPTSVKKTFSGKGNSGKEEMAQAFRDKFGFWVHEAIQSRINGSASDVVDSVAVNECLRNVS